MKRKLVTMLAVLAAVSLSAATLVHAQATEEPPKESEALKQSLAEGTITGFLEGTATFPFSAELGEVIVFSVNSTEFDPYLEILDNAGDLIASDDDSGPSTNSLLVFVAPANAEYTVLVRPFSEGATGNFSLSMVKTIAAVSPNEPTTVELRDTSPVVRALTAATDAYSIVLSGEEAFDAAMVVFDSAGFVIDQTESNQVQALQLPKTTFEVGKAYYLAIVPYAGQEVTLSLEVQPAQFLTLTEEPQAVEFLADQYEDSVLVNVAEGEQYLLTVSADYPVSVSVSLEGFEIDTFASMSLSGVEGGSMIFTAGGTGKAFVRISNNSYIEGDSRIFYLSIRPME